MENSPSNYRDGLAEDLKDIRSQGEEGKNNAKEFLGLAKKTNRYIIAEEKHHKRNNLVTVPESNLESKEEDRQSLEGKSLVEQAYEAVLKSSKLFILINGSGKVFDSKRAATIGSMSGIYNKQLGRFQEFVQSSQDEVEVTKVLDSGYDTHLQGRALRKVVLKDGEAIVADISVQGKQGNKFYEDNRRGGHLTCALWFPNEKVLREEFGAEVASELFDESQLLTQNSGLLLETLLQKLLPEYYKEVVIGDKK